MGRGYMTKELRKQIAVLRRVAEQASDEAFASAGLARIQVLDDTRRQRAAILKDALRKRK